MSFYDRQPPSRTLSKLLRVCFAERVSVRSLTAAGIAFLLVPFVTGLSLAQSTDSADVLRKAVENGERVIQALRKYEYTRDIKVQPVKPDSVISGMFHRVSRFNHAARSAELTETIEDQKSTVTDDTRVDWIQVDRIANFYYFLISPATQNQYEFNYIGRERVDELGTYVFDIRPRSHKGGGGFSRFIKGRVWIDDQDFQVVKVSGEITPPPGPHRTPRFETYFKNYGEYWFPAYTWADDDLVDGKNDFRAIIEVRYSLYKSENLATNN